MKELDPFISVTQHYHWHDQNLIQILHNEQYLTRCLLFTLHDNHKNFE